MGYQKSNGQWARTDSMTLATAVAVTATGVIAGSTQEVGDKTVLRLTSTVSAVAGTDPSATVAVQTAPTLAGTYVTVGSFTAATAAGSERKQFSGLDRFVRLNVTAFAGTDTPSVTFSSIAGEAA